MGSYTSSPHYDYFSTLNSKGTIVESIADINRVQLPYIRFIDNNPNPIFNSLGFVFAHGLGASNPKLKGYHNDEWGAIVCKVSTSLSIDTMMYTARGHGASDGWKDTIDSEKDQFTWRRLADDMHELALSQGFNQYIATGSSMGSATALFAAIKYPLHVKAVILIRPPTAWEGRLARRKFLISSADKLRKKELQDTGIALYSKVLQAAALSDLPRVDEDILQYQNILCPVLILTIKGDEAHPVSTANLLHSVIINSTLYVSESIDDVKSTWPQLIEEFLVSLK